MNAPPPSDPQIAERVASTIELWAKIAGGVLGVWALLTKVAKPYQEWKREQLAISIEKQLKPTLEKLNAAINEEHDCVQQLQEMHQQITAVFHDLDVFIDIAVDNRERHDEHDALMDQVFGLERRVDLAKRKEIDEMLKTIRQRSIARRRGLDEEETSNDQKEGGQ